MTKLLEKWQALIQSLNFLRGKMIDLDQEVLYLVFKEIKLGVIKNVMRVRAFFIQLVQIKCKPIDLVYRRSHYFEKFSHSFDLLIFINLKFFKSYHSLSLSFEDYFQKILFSI